jgi:radical SAM superfamily enzyme YgiQ (UPF0313 family)
MLSFLRRNKIEPLKAHRKSPALLAGGQGVSNTKCLEEIIDIFKGEYDGELEDPNGYRRLQKLDSEPAINGAAAVIELTRGCKYRCRFCEYGWVAGGKYREKSVHQVLEEINRLYLANGVKRFNFLSADLGAYSDLPTLMEYCQTHKISVANTDVSLRSFENAKPHFSRQKTIKIGIESFDEGTRRRMNKPFPDIELERFFEWAMLHTSNLHLYLIYGLPGDNFESWFRWIQHLGRLRAANRERPIRIEFNITNFEPCPGTPLEKAPWVDFTAKAEFLNSWTEALTQAGFWVGSKKMTYKNGSGRLGRKEDSYNLLMHLKTDGSENTMALINSLPQGVGRSIKDTLAQRFLRVI